MEQCAHSALLARSLNPLLERISKPGQAPLQLSQSGASAGLETTSNPGGTVSGNAAVLSLTLPIHDAASIAIKLHSSA
jgi:hypothetical protein